MWPQAFIENTAVDVMGYQVDVRDIGKAHVLAAEVGLTFSSRIPAFQIRCSAITHACSGIRWFL